MTEKMGYLSDDAGNKSSKRLWGSILLCFGIFLASILFGFSIVKPEHIYTTATTILETFIVGGSSLLGIGVFERILGKSKK